MKNIFLRSKWDVSCCCFHSYGLLLVEPGATHLAVEVRSEIHFGFLLAKEWPNFSWLLTVCLRSSSPWFLFREVSETLKPLYLAPEDPQIVFQVYYANYRGRGIIIFFSFLCDTVLPQGYPADSYASHCQTRLIKLFCGKPLFVSSWPQPIAWDYFIPTAALLYSLNSLAHFSSL